MSASVRKLAKSTYLDQENCKYNSDLWVFKANVIGDCFDKVSFNFSEVDANWKNSIKSYVARMLDASLEKGNPNLILIRNRFYCVCRFQSWCSKSFIESPFEIDMGVIREYIDFFCRVDSGGSPCKRNISLQIRVLRSFFDGVKPEAAFATECEALIRSTRKRYEYNDNSQVEELPENFVLELLAEAIEMVEKDASKIIHLRDSFKAHLVGERRKGRKASAAAARKIIVEAEKVKLHSYGLQLDLTKPLQLGRALNIIEGASITVLAFLCAQRISELRRASVTDVESSSFNGEAYSVMRGVLSKSTRSHEWVMAPAAVAAFKVIQAITEPFRVKNGQVALFFTGSGARVWGSNWDDVARLTVTSQTTLTNKMTTFVNSTNAAKSSTVKRKVNFRDARRFLARFVARRDKTSLGSLARQYGHLDTRITDTYYVRNDKQLGKIIGDEARNEVSKALSDLAFSDHIYVGGDSANLREVKARLSAVLKRSSTQLDALRMLGGGTILGPCDWGYCLYHKATSKCEGGEFAPSDARRTPNICATCTNFAATPRHLNWWMSRVADLRAFCRLKNIPEQAKHIASERLIKAELVVANLINTGACDEKN